MMAQESVDFAFATMLAEGVRFEQRQLRAGFAIEDQSECNAAFVEGRKPVFRNR